MTTTPAVGSVPGPASDGAEVGTAPSPSGPPQWLLLVLALAAVAAIAFAVGRFTTFGSMAEASAPRTDSADAGFARDMQVHHAQAVDMAMTIYRKTDDDTLRTMAYDIATNQSAQKGEMYDWLLKWGLPQKGGPLMEWMLESDAHAEHGGTSDPAQTEDELMVQMGVATDAQLARLAAATGTEADCLFLELMIRHHEGAVPMGKAVIELGSDPRAMQFGRTIVATQTAEIDAMRSLQTRLACTP